MYDLTTLEISVGHLINGCGKRIEKPVFINIKKGDDYIVQNENVNVEPLKWLLTWLESEYIEK